MLNNREMTQYKNEH